MNMDHFAHKKTQNLSVLSYRALWQHRFYPLFNILSLCVQIILWQSASENYCFQYAFIGHPQRWNDWILAFMYSRQQHLCYFLLKGWLWEIKGWMGPSSTNIDWKLMKVSFVQQGAHETIIQTLLLACHCIANNVAMIWWNARFHSPNPYTFATFSEQRA